MKEFDEEEIVSIATAAIELRKDKNHSYHSMVGAGITLIAAYFEDADMSERDCMQALLQSFWEAELQADINRAIERAHNDSGEDIQADLERDLS
jgi:hypothetical protein